MSRVFIGVGSNEGDRLALISQAVKLLGAVEGVQLTRLATIIETEPMGGPPQPPFLNTVVEVETARAPQELLAALQDIERRLGRVPSSIRWAPRPIDLDLLLYGDRVINEPGLTVPHPRMHERLFVLGPLAQLAPDLLHPVLHETVAGLAEALDRPAAPWRAP
ncbi:MAG: 2-amino-4-hydroxy-6-hydroxymethyldihydropteridine diphosphokinase [Omnitrophica WOR_2 bacterium RIFCSPHIGHO2_02_FULL_68_15]|nr:MAG: 2-amino-4-hydroxy-6-hydroxymethyldihydropteridine diphosphokinase [Omnitrophica WOR_2 bacterium RIFCSPHIGHO2_02_FULL_68_15]